MHAQRTGKNHERKSSLVSIETTKKLNFDSNKKSESKIRFSEVKDYAQSIDDNSVDKIHKQHSIDKKNTDPEFQKYSFLHSRNSSNSVSGYKFLKYGDKYTRNRSSSLHHTNNSSTLAYSKILATNKTSMISEKKTTDSYKNSRNNSILTTSEMKKQKSFMNQVNEFKYFSDAKDVA